MTAYAIQSPPHAGQQLTMPLPTTGAVDTWPTGANVAAVIVGPSSASMNVTLPVPTFDGLAVTGRVVTIATGQTWIVPLPPSVYGVGPITVTWAGTLTASAVAIVTVAGS